MSLELNGAQKRDLRSRAQLLEPLIRIGSAGLNEAVTRSLDAALTQHELVKLKFTDFKEQKKELGAQLSAATLSVLVQIVGNVAVFYRPRSASREA
jgi:RNA-binding protein